MDCSRRVGQGGVFLGAHGGELTILPVALSGPSSNQRLLLYSPSLAVQDHGTTSELKRSLKNSRLKLTEAPRFLRSWPTACFVAGYIRG